MNKIFEGILDTFPLKIDYVRTASMGVPKNFVINLAIPLTDQIYNIAGNVFYVWSSANETDYVDIKVNNTNEPATRFVRQTGLNTPFDKLLITTPAGQSGDMVILYGTEAPELLQIIDNRSATVSGLVSILGELQGDQVHENWGTEITVGNVAAVQVLAANANRKAMCCQAKAVNTGIIYLGFDNTVTTTKWIAELQAGVPFTVDDYRGPIFARADAAGQLLGWGEW